MFLCNYTQWNSERDVKTITFRNGMGSPMSTLLYCLLSCDNVISVRSFNLLLSIRRPSSVLLSHLPSRSITSIWPDKCSTVICTLSELRILHTVEVDSRVLPLKIFFSKILLINVDFPALVSPAKQYQRYTKILENVNDHEISTTSVIVMCSQYKNIPF